MGLEQNLNPFWLITYIYLEMIAIKSIEPHAKAFNIYNKSKDIFVKNRIFTIELGLMDTGGHEKHIGLIFSR